MMTFLIIASIILVSTSQVFGVDWHEETSLSWALGCDWSGNDLSSKKGPGEQCGSNCGQTAGCTHFTWTDYEGGTCWMKKTAVSKDHATRASGSAVCGIMKSATSGGGGGGGISWHDDADVSWAEMCDFADNDLSSKKVPGEQCGNTCKGTGGCTHFTWTNYEGGTCWMKKNGATKNQAKKTTEYSVCGIMKATGGGGGGGGGGISWHDDADVSWAEMCDFAGNDLSSKKVPGEQCGNTCKGTGGCTHFTWTNYEGGTCWMKKNGATKDQAKKTTEYSVCGIMKATGGGGGGGAPGQVRTINHCSFPVWVGAFGQQGTPENGGWKLDPGQEHTVSIPINGLWSGRFWGRTDCNDQGQCSTGRCSGLLCKGTTGQPPASLAEITFNGAGGLDYYDVSLVDGYNLPIKMRPMSGTFVKGGGNPAYDCTEAGCDSNLNAICPNELAFRVNGKVVGCKSACEAFGTDQYCCKGAHNTPQTCPATDYSNKFKQACPRAYSYAYDDKTSTYTCKASSPGKGAGYEVQFC